jgi:UDP-N-acetylglucosamine 2-epimerase (non-hydrolysing)
MLTGQHREQVQHGLKPFNITVAIDLGLMTDRQDLASLAGRMLPAATSALRGLDPQYVLVYGDTLSSFVVAWAAFLMGVPVGHVEAGLRSFDLAEPFPEEATRRLTSVLSTLDLAPTSVARSNLVREGKDASSIVVTGQTVVDAIKYAAGVGELPAEIPGGETLVTITMHRRENWRLLPDLARAIVRVARDYPDLTFVYPVHLNPVVREAVCLPMSAQPNVMLIEPLDYCAMAALLVRSCLIVTDSGGLQEEGAALDVPVLVLRNVTERPEGVESGKVILAGTDPSGVERHLRRLIDDRDLRTQMSAAANPFGDGRAGWRVSSAVEWKLGLSDRPADWECNNAASSDGAAALPRS